MFLPEICITACGVPTVAVLTVIGRLFLCFDLCENKPITKNLFIAVMLKM